MADLEAVLADVSYLVGALTLDGSMPQMAMEKSRSQPAARASKKITLPDPSVRSIMQKYLEKTGGCGGDGCWSMDGDATPE